MCDGVGGGGMGGLRVYGVGGWVCDGVGGWLEGSWVGGWRVHRVEGCVVVWVVGWRIYGVEGCDGVGGGGVGGWRVHREGGSVGGSGMHGGVGGWRVYGVGACTHPHMNIYNVKRFNFMNTQPPIKHIQSVTLLLYIYSPTHEQL